ncbi:MAG: DUF3800 domain-containing protein [Gaiellaceae bacterium]
MADVYVYADEAGNFDFSLNAGATRYFVLTTVTLDPTIIGPALTTLRYDLAWRGVAPDTVFHATSDQQAVRDEVFACLNPLPFQIDATILEKRKAQPHLQLEQKLYQMAWWLHFKWVAPRIAQPGDRLFVAAASLGTKKKRGLFQAAVQNVVFQVSPAFSYRVAFWPCESDPCLQVADYCTWALQRKWELADARSHVLVQSKIKTEYDVWRIGTTYYY